MARVFELLVVASVRGGVVCVHVGPVLSHPQRRAHARAGGGADLLHVGPLELPRGALPTF